mmetsp:Transcript_24126/g.49997  ORF Transcript_24126/g.49997 Transcript_24126/m.49997 type:complete len:81 (-) Transcript_24126:57-299(-)
MLLNFCLLGPLICIWRIWKERERLLFKDNQMTRENPPIFCNVLLDDLDLLFSGTVRGEFSLFLRQCFQGSNHFKRQPGRG